MSRDGDPAHALSRLGALGVTPEPHVQESWSGHREHDHPEDDRNGEPEGRRDHDREPAAGDPRDGVRALEHELAIGLAEAVHRASWRGSEETA